MIIRKVLQLRFCQLICENYVQFFTALENTRIFQTVFNYLQKKAFAMACWNGTKTRWKKASLLVSKIFACFIETLSGNYGGRPGFSF